MARWLIGPALWAIGQLSDPALSRAARALFSRSWRRFSRDVDAPRAAQTVRLLSLVGRARDTDFGRAHGFGSIKNWQDFKRNVPIRAYEDFEPYLKRMVSGEDNVLIPDRPYYFGRSSGTTGTPKYIPVTPAYVAEYRQPRRVWARQVMQAFPGLVRGKILTMHSPRIDGVTQGGTPYGSVTVGLGGRRAVARSGIGHPAMEPSPSSVYLVEDFDLKYYVLLRLAAQHDVSLAAAINPSTLVLLAHKLEAHADRLVRDLTEGTLSGGEGLPKEVRAQVDRLLRSDPQAADRIRGSRKQYGRVLPTALWPRMSGLLSWKGGSAPFYLRQLQTLYPGLAVMDYGYVATEGGFSIPLSPEAAGGVVAVSGHVLEFVPEAKADQDNPETCLADELEVGARYRVLVTGCHGLYRYDINDVVECVGRVGATAEIAFVHKGGNMLSITGEKIGEQHVVLAGTRAEAATGVRLAGLSMAVELSDPPGYLFAVEGEQSIDDATGHRLLEALEAGLRAVNLEYDAKRSSQRLAAPKLLLLAEGAFDRERQRRVDAGAPDSHVKPPHLVRDISILERMGIRKTLS